MPRNKGMFGRVASANAIASLAEETPEQKAARYNAGSRTHMQIGGIFLTTFAADVWASKGATLMHLTVCAGRCTLFTSSSQSTHAGRFHGCCMALAT